MQTIAHTKLTQLTREKLRNKRNERLG